MGCKGTHCLVGRSGVDCDVGVPLALVFGPRWRGSPRPLPVPDPLARGRFCVSPPSSSCEGASSSCSTYLIPQQSTRNPFSRSSPALS